MASWVCDNSLFTGVATPNNLWNAAIVPALKTMKKAKTPSTTRKKVNITGRSRRRRMRILSSTQAPMYRAPSSTALTTVCSVSTAAVSKKPVPLSQSRCTHAECSLLHNSAMSLSAKRKWHWYKSCYIPNTRILISLFPRRYSAAVHVLRPAGVGHDQCKVDLWHSSCATGSLSETVSIFHAKARI